MRSFSKVCCIGLMGLVSLISCKNDPDERTEYVSEIGTWDLSAVEYIYDGTKLNYNGWEIGVWPTSPESDSYYMDHFYFVSQGGFIFEEGGNGKLFGMGEFSDEEHEFTYSREGNKIKIKVGELEVETIIEKGYISGHGIQSDIYGWSIDNPDGDDEIQGTDGKCNHKLEIVQIYSRRK